MIHPLKEVVVLLLSPWKFAVTFPFAIMVLKMSWMDTLLYTNLGGIIGIVVFGLLSKLVILLWDQYWPERFKINKNNKKVHTKKNRTLVKIKKYYGLPGIVILSPVVLSIPVGSFLITKYYGNKTINYLWQMLGQFIWSIIYVIFYNCFYQLLNQ